MTIIILLVIILLLLVAIVAMMVSGWPGRERAEIERVGNSLRREMAELRAESIRLLHAIRIEVEDSVKESIEREMAGYGSRGGRSRGPKKTPKPVSEDSAAMSGMAGAPQLIEAEPFDDATADTALAARQLLLFGEPPVPVRQPEPIPKPALSAPAATSPKEQEPETEPQTIFVGYIDDIPDVE
jgi:hypothetical protein